jgi:Vault protein inter-alpha-trypsin.
MPPYSARDSNRFTVSVNVEPQKKVTFNLTYEELLTRKLGLYNHVINLQPGQEVQDLQVQVLISESRNITVLRVPEVRSGNEIDPDQDKKGKEYLPVLLFYMLCCLINITTLAETVK